jgi:SAM-dependent methyltransferase/dephospho-CoA kinase
MNRKKQAANEQYLSHLSDPLGGGDDKYEISKYLEAQGGATVLEIGPGAGKALLRMMAVSDGWHRTDNIFTLDLDVKILNALNRDPIISKHPDFRCIQGNALALPFSDSSFDIVNLSAVAHECTSYGGDTAKVVTLVEEVSRVLKLNGVLIFRDLEGVDLDRVVECTLAGAPIMAFLALFLKRFLSRPGDRLPHPYRLEDVTIDVDERRLSLAEYLAYSQLLTPDSTVRLKAQCGLVREIQRHFITFVDAYAPEFVFETDQAFDPDSIIVRFEKNASADAFRAFCAKHKIPFHRHTPYAFEIDRAKFSPFKAHLTHKFLDLFTPKTLRSPASHLDTVRTVLAQQNIHYEEKDGAFILSLGDLLLAETRLGGVNVTYEIDPQVLDWSRREGQESYFFASRSETLLTFVQNSLRLEPVHETDWSGYTCLAPFESKFVPRPKYIEILKTLFRPAGETPDCCELEGKRIIHFKKEPLEKAFPQIVRLIYQNRKAADSAPVRAVLETFQAHIRDYVSRSISFNADMQQEMAGDAFIRDLLVIEDDVNAISASPDLKKIEGKNVILVGQLATKKEAFKLYFEGLGYTVVSLTDCLLAEIHKPRATRKDLFLAGIKLREEHGNDVLARRVVEKIKKEKITRFVILGCRHPYEINYIRTGLNDNIAVVGLFPKQEELIRRLHARFPNTEEASFLKWIAWNNGQEADKNTNIRTCLQVCDVLFPDPGNGADNQPQQVPQPDEDSSPSI